MKRVLSFLICVGLLLTMIPMPVFGATDTDEVLFLDNGYIQLAVAKDNGGFEVQTLEGNRIIKSDNNKRLLYHSDAYDTSFISFQVTDSKNKTKEYIFGGIYGDLYDASRSGVDVYKNSAGTAVNAVWSTGKLTFTVVYSLASEDSNENGMVQVAVNVTNSGDPVTVKSRILLDTAFGGLDYGTYVAKTNESEDVRISAETLLDGSAYRKQLENFYAVDDPSNTTITSYTVNFTEPYQIAFGHWNNLAASLFNFSPDPALTFTNARNEFKTADSAVALYYDLGTVTKTETGSLLTYYGVYSNKSVSSAESVTVNVTAPLRLNLNDARTDFARLTDKGTADFSVDVTFENYASDTAQVLSKVKLAVKTTSNLRSLDDYGQPLAGYDFNTAEPMTISYADIPVGGIETKSLYFEAKNNPDAAYERVTVGVYDVSQTGGSIAEANKLGERSFYILLPGTEGDLPKVSFTAMTPDIIYTEGTRHLFVGLTNDTLLTDTAIWTLTAVPEDGSDGSLIPHENITIKDGVMDVALTDDISLAEGPWHLQLNWTDAAVQREIVTEKTQYQTAEVLKFTVSADKQYKNDIYGILAVVEYKSGSGSGTNYTHRIQTFKNEEELKAFEADTDSYEEILFIIRGEFTATKTVSSGTGTMGTQFSAISTRTLDADRKWQVDNSITINDCLDFENGTMTVYYENYDNPYAALAENSAVCIEMDGHLYTNKERTSVWEGKAAFTMMEQGENYDLIPYDENGNRDDTDGEPITLVWPSIFSEAQTLAGLLFDFAFGQMGVMKDEDDTVLGRVVSFSGSLDLSFTGTKGDEAGSSDGFWSDMVNEWADWRQDMSLLKYSDNCCDYFNRHKKVADSSVVTQTEDDDDPECSASVLISDVLFGCGEGFVGVNFEVGVAISNFVESMPNIEGTIAINTINDWSFGIEGNVELSSFQLEAKVSFKSHNNIPVPDELYVFFSGFKPGINVDGFGILWITGGGGGISDLYDSIFLTQAVPPLKLMMAVSFNIFQVLYCEKAQLAIGLTGFELTAENIKVMDVDALTIIPQASLGLEWYPGIDLKAAIQVNLFGGVISGGGYIVLVSEDYKEYFFEAFARAQVCIPDDIILLGGKTLAGVDLGINNEKIWGQLSLMGLDLGVTYYWGESSVSFGKGTLAQPTYPDLLGMTGIPVYYDEERDQTLYMNLGTNTKLIASSIGEDSVLALAKPRLTDTLPAFDPDSLLASASAPLFGAATLKSSADRKSHFFNLGIKSGSGAIVQISYAADSKDSALATAAQITIENLAHKAAPLVFGPEFAGNSYGFTVGTDAQANANVTYDSASGTGTLAFAAATDAFYGVDWLVTTPVNADMLIYGVDPLPKLSSVAGSLSGTDLTITWTGAAAGDLSSFDSVSFFLCEDSAAPASVSGTDGTVTCSFDDGAIGYEVLKLTDTTRIAAGSQTVSVPSGVPTGSYYLRAVYNKADQVNGSVYSASPVSYVNADTPAACSAAAVPCGDLQYRVTVADNGDAAADGYLVTVYDSKGNATDFAGIRQDKAASGDTVFTVGGSYTGTDNNGGQTTIGLTAGSSYTIGVTPFHKNAGENSYVYGPETRVAAGTLPRKNTPAATFAGSAPVKTVTETLGGTGSGKSVSTQRDVYTTGDLSIAVSFDQSVSGSWTLDGGTPEAFADVKSVSVSKAPSSLTGSAALEDGTHTLSVSGSNAAGDGFHADYVFRVDTQAPRLLLSSPVSGGFLKQDDTLTVAGITDADALLTVTCDGKTLCADRSVSVAADGSFSLTLQVPDAAGSKQHQIVITAADEVGNSVSEEAVLTYGGYGDIAGLKLYVNGAESADGTLIPGETGNTTASLSLMAVTGSGKTFALDSNDVHFVTYAQAGSIALSDGVLTVSPDAKGYVSAGFEASNGYYRWVSLCVNGKDAQNGEQQEQGGNNSYGSVYRQFITHAGTQVTKEIPAGVDVNAFTAYYFKDGVRTYVADCGVKDGKLFFTAPVSGIYYFAENRKSFTDVSGSWAEPFVQFCAAREIFSGYPDDSFRPGAAMTRAMFVTVLYNLAGAPAVTAEDGSCPDVAAGSWYASAVAWAKANGIVSGFADGSFRPDNTLTREQMCVLLLNFMKCMGYEVPDPAAEDFADETQISAWASPAVDLCRTMELVSGKPGNRFAPADSLTRAECCAVLYHLLCR